MSKPEPKRQRDRLLSARFILAACAAMQQERNESDLSRLDLYTLAALAAALVPDLDLVAGWFRQLGASSRHVSIRVQP